MVEGREVAGVGAFEADQARHGLLGRHFRQYLNFIRYSAEAGAFHQMGGEAIIPIGGGDGREIILPDRRSSGLRDGGGKKGATRHSLRHVRTPSEPAIDNVDRYGGGM